MLQKGTPLENNKYQIEGVIGRGGFGYVYRARERLTSEVVAIKELVPNFVSDPQIVQRFIREARATLRLTHPHIARTYGIFQDRGTYYLAMEYLPGGSLADRLKQGPLPLEKVVSITVDLCEALAYAHSQGVVHCDIKPANVLFDAKGEAHLADFGIAHVSEQMMTRQLFTATGVTMGTVRYMAPEQLEGIRDDPRLDVYAMGAMMYEMLSGFPYLDFETESTPASQMRNIQRIQNEPPRSLQTAGRSVPPWLAQVVERSLRKAPEERFASATELRQALLGAEDRPQEHEPLSATRGAPEPPPAETPTPAPASQDAAARSRGVPSWLWIGAGGIGLLCIGCFVVFLLIGVFSEIETIEEPTNTPRPTQTSTRTHVATPTLTSTPTPKPSATAVPLPETILLRDSFDSNENGWGPGTKDDEFWRGEKSIKDGKYIWRIEEVHQSVMHRETPIEAPEDFYISVDAQRVSEPIDTACYILVYRKSNVGYYRFEVCDIQYYRIHMRYEEEWQKVLGWTESSTIRPGAVNNLAVRAVGDRFDLFINEQFVNSINDDSLSSGNVGIGISLQKGDTARFEFDNFVLRSPQ